MSVEFEAAKKAHKVLRVNLQNVKNKAKRDDLYSQSKREKKKLKKKLKLKRKKETQALGEDAPAPKVPRTLDNTREADETVVKPEDEEVKADEQHDEFANYFSGDRIPKICITTSYRATKLCFDFIKDLLIVFPNSFFYERKHFPLKKIVEEASTKGWTDLIIIHEDKKKLNSLTIIHLPHGPTAFFKLTSLELSQDIKGHGRPTSHKPEVILNNFTTRLGHRVGRMLGALFHQEPNFKGRRVVTFHNQRDFIFFRHHRYIFASQEKARLQELGPRFTLKLKWLQHGTFDTKQGEYEWKHKAELDTSRRRFHL